MALRPSRLVGAPPGKRRRDERLAALLDAAAALFVEKGLAATSIDDIAERAGVAKGTFYHYFQDRAAMLEGLRKRYSQHFAEAAEAAIGNCSDCWQQRLHAWVDTVAREYLASYALHDAIFHEPVVCSRCVMSEEPVVLHLAALLEEGRAAGAWHVADSLRTAVCMFHSLHGLVDEAIATGESAEAVADFLSALFARMLQPPV